MTSPIDHLVAALGSGGFGPRPTPRGYEARCPAHDGRRRNLSVAEGDDGRVLVRCHAAAGCDHRAIVAALGLDETDLFPPREERPWSEGRPMPRTGSRPKPGRDAPPAFPSKEDAVAALARRLGRPTVHDDPPTADGVPWAVVRFDRPAPATGEPYADPARRKGNESYRPIHAAAGGWRVGDPPGRLPLYRGDELDGAGVVWVVEGEKCADLARDAIGLAATSPAHGAGSARRSDWSPLAGKVVVIQPDADAAGETFLAAVLGELARLSPRPEARVVRVDALWRSVDPIPEGAGIDDWYVEGIPEAWEPAQCLDAMERAAAEAAAEGLGTGVAAGDEPDGEGAAWPALRLGGPPPVDPFPVDALPVLAADFVRAVAASVGGPEDFVAVPALVAAGAAVGRGVSLLLKPGYFASAALDAMNVGGPSSGKSPALEAVIRPLRAIDDQLHAAYRAERDVYDRSLESY